MKIVMGLGNPGEEYANTYHNAGALAVRRMAGALTFKTHKKAGHELFSYATGESGTSHEGRVFVLPLVFMNQSGAAAREALTFFNATPEELIVIHDESDLPVGSFKLSRERGSAGHKGIESIVSTLGTNEFTRIRIGIRNPRETKRRKAEEFVLKKISASDRATFRRMDAAIEEAIQGVGGI